MPATRKASSEDLGPARAMLQDLAVEVRALEMPAALAALGEALVNEAERAVRATDLVAHGLDSLLASRGPYEAEAQTSLKRGALNLRHAREVFGRAAGEIVAALQPADLAPGPHGVSNTYPPVVCLVRFRIAKYKTPTENFVACSINTSYVLWFKTSRLGSGCHFKGNSWPTSVRNLMRAKESRK